MNTLTSSLFLVSEDNPVLHQVCSPVDSITPLIVGLAEQMIQVMVKEGGVGLAAPQVGVPLRIIVVLDETPCVWINPSIVSSEGFCWFEEGCLSLPGQRKRKFRSKTVRVRAQDLNGRWHEKEYTGLLSICFQHEIDHLNGVLMTD